MKRFVWDVLLARIVPALFFALATVSKLFVATDAQLVAERSFTDAIHFGAELCGLLFYGLLTFSYVTRLPRKSGDRSLLVILVVLVTAGASAYLGVTAHRARPALELASAVVVIIGTAYTLWALLHLRKAFSILPEARALVTTGPYALSRHPLYLGETIVWIGFALALGDLRALLVVPIVAGQVVRMSWEERVLGAEFPAEYADYRAHVRRWVPFLL